MNNITIEKGLPVFDSNENRSEFDQLRRIETKLDQFFDILRRLEPKKCECGWFLETGEEEEAPVIEKNNAGENSPTINLDEL